VFTVLAVFNKCFTSAGAEDGVSSLALSSGKMKVSKMLWATKRERRRHGKKLAARQGLDNGLVAASQAKFHASCAAGSGLPVKACLPYGQ
jgi:hypothetical protein